MIRQNKLRIALYGAGKRCKEILPLIRLSDVEVCAVIDANASNLGDKIEEYPLFSKEYLHKLENCILCVTVARFPEKIENEIRGILQKSVRIVSYFQLQYELIYQNEQLMMDFQKIVSSHYGNEEVYSIFSCPNGMVLGGVEYWTIDVVSGLSEVLEKRCRILTSDYKETERAIDEFFLARIIHSNESIFTEYNISAIAKYLVQMSPCVIITSFPDIVLVLAVILKSMSLKIGIISVVHSDLILNYKSNALVKEMINYYVGVSSTVCKGLVNEKIDVNKVACMTSPVFCDVNLLREFNLNAKNAIRIGWAGRIQVEEKRCDLLVKIVSELSRRETPFILSIAGQGNYAKTIEKIVIQNQMEESVRLVGTLSRAEMPLFWQKQDIGLMVSDYEGHSLTQMEIMANCAVPISTDVSGARDDIIDGKNGYIVPLEDYAEIVRKIEYLNSHRELLRLMGNEAKRIIEKKCRREDHIKFWEKILDDVANEVL